MSSPREPGGAGASVLASKYGRSVNFPGHRSYTLGMGADFRGCLALSAARLLTSTGGPGRPYDDAVQLTGLHDPELDRRIPAAVLGAAPEGAALACAAHPPLDVASYREGHPA